MKKSVFVLILMLLVAANMAARPFYTLKYGSVGSYSIDKKPGISDYEWRVFTDSKLSLPVSPSDVQLTVGGVGSENEVQVAWQTPGIYYLAVFAIGDNGCTNTMAFPFEITQNIDFVAIDDNVVLYVGHEEPINVLDNDIDNLNVVDIASLSSVQDPVKGLALPNDDGTFSYVPNLGFVGVDSFQYRICTNAETPECDEAWVYVDVRENQPPFADDLSFDATFETDSVYQLWVNAIDPEGMLDISSLEFVSSASLGSLQLFEETGEVLYRPYKCTVGRDSFTYVIYDDFGLVSNEATVYLSLAIDPLRDSDFDGVLDYIEDLDGDGNPCSDDTDGDGVPNYLDVDDDDDGILTINEDINGDNDPTNDDTDGDGILNYLDPDDDNDCMLTVEEITQNDGEIWSDLDQNGVSDVLDDDDNGDGVPSCDQMQDWDGNGVLDRSEIWNSQAVDDYITVGMNEMLEMTVLDNDSSHMLPETIKIIEYPYNGTASVNSAYGISYTPDTDYEGEDSLYYEVCNYYNICETALVFINVKDLISPPQLFTPNNDGENDRYVIKGLERYPDNHFFVYNRWGNKVYEKSGYSDEWDGYSNVRSGIGNKKLTVGVYYYVLKYGDREKAGALFLER